MKNWPYISSSPEVSLLPHLSDIEKRTTYQLDANDVSNCLYDVWKGTRLGEFVPNSSTVKKSFLRGAYKYRKAGFPVASITAFLQLFRSLGDEKRKIILSNLHSSFDTLDRFVLPPPTFTEDDIPF